MKKSFPWIYFEASVGDQFEKSGFELDGSVDHFNLNPFRPSLLWSKSIAIIIILLLWFHDWNSCMKIRHLVAYLARKLMRNQAVSIKRSIPHCHFIPFPWIFYFSCTIKWFQKFSVALRTAKPSNSVYIWCFNSVHAENMKLVISTSFSRSHKFIADESSEIQNFPVKSSLGIKIMRPDPVMELNIESIISIKL